MISRLAIILLTLVLLGCIEQRNNENNETTVNVSVDKIDEEMGRSIEQGDKEDFQTVLGTGEDREFVGGVEEGTGESTICFFYKKGEDLFYIDRGSVYIEDRYIGEAESGCIEIKNCNDYDGGVAYFYPESVNRFNYSIRSSVEVVPCESSVVFISENMFNEFSRLKWAIPYVENIITEDEYLKETAEEITKGCSDISCSVNKLYRYVVTNFEYLPDPEEQELIRPPYETIDIGGGDCEDLSSLLNSYLENVNIKTLMVLTDDHAYSLACDVDIEKIKKYIKEDFTEVEKVSGELKKNEVYYYGGVGESGEETEEYRFVLTADEPVDVYIVPSKREFNNIVRDKEFTYYETCSTEDVTEFDSTCVIDEDGGIVIIPSSITDFELEFYYQTMDTSALEIRYYTIANETCVVLDPTAGVYGFPGYETFTTYVKIAIDPDTYEYWYLTSS